jgi:protein-tyrosine phosphatase
MAHFLLEKKLKELGKEGIEVLTAGIAMLGALGVSNDTKELLAREGIDASAHRSQMLTKEMINKSDLILVMEKLHEDIVLQLAPQVKNRVFLLKEFAKIDDSNLDIEDPIGKSREFYEQTFVIIKEAVEKVSKII